MSMFLSAQTVFDGVCHEHLLTPPSPYDNSCLHGLHYPIVWLIVSERDTNCSSQCTHT